MNFSKRKDLEEIRKGKRGRSKRMLEEIGKGKKECVSEVKMEEQEGERERGSSEKLGLQSPLPYLYLVHTKTNEFSRGVSFASAAAGILNSTNRCLDLPLIDGLDDEISHFTIPMDEQVEYYIKTRGILVENLGESRAAKLLSESVFTIVIGSTDIGTYFYSRCASVTERRSPQQFIDIIVITMKRHLKRIYDHGGRKFVILGIGPIGCTPSARVNTKNEACDEVSNYWASKYNQALLLVLRDLISEFQDFIYSYINIYDLFLNIVEQADSYGFKDKKTACCGLGRLNADEACYPISSLCPDRSDHVFWDLYHPTEAFTRIIVEAAFDGPQHYAFPVNVRQLVST
ncbi:hypothetical protein BVRB_000670 [Beta vulgaris subsp. vulgaris]|uniref:Uncharacterized protein n=1 Tax=Beta vulgaris subsp. vulgaris TaxID=3555 RepID=A0A0J8DZG1_BETVV|nr:hypothetical protein BVRB_000670 [Beta vulgaris subsp. vulgaris]